MPIYKNPSMNASNKSNAAGDDHASEAAKVKRTREQAYFNSYDFDAIEVLPYDEDEDEDDDRQKPQLNIKQLQKKAAFDRGLHTIHNGLIAKYYGLRAQSPRQSQRRHMQRGSLSSATPSSGSSTRSSSLSGTYSLSRNNYAYLKRLGMFLSETNKPESEKTTGKANNLTKIAKKPENGGHFSLPRPNLQYQSINNDTQTVSMPLVANTVSSATSSGTTMLTKAKTISKFPLQSHENGSSRSQARLTTAARNDGQIKGFQMRTKKDSSSSSTISTDSAIVSATEIDIRKNSTSTLLSMKSKPKTKSNSGKDLSAESENTEGGGRRDSSHYSTNKSGSSGYYSSNVCSTYSLEDHIYSEPVALDGVLDKLHAKSKSVQLARQNRNHTAAAVDVDVDSGSDNNLNILKNSRSQDMHGVATGKAGAIEAEDGETDEADHLARMLTLKKKQQQIQGNSAVSEMTFNENLRILENSIENLDRHLRNFPSLPAQERITAFVQTPNHHAANFLSHHLPTIMEGYVPNSQPRSWTDDMADDSLMDIDLDSFLLSNDKHKQTVKTANGIDNPSFLADEQEENTYKCVKYINSCPEDAYRVESDIVTVSDNSDQFRQRYEDQIHFENTRELLEDVRDKIRSLTLTSATLTSSAQFTEMPQELEAMIKALKRELENYLARINQHSDREIRQLCTGIVKNQNVVRLTKAFEKRRSEYEIGVFAPTSGVPLSIKQQITSIRCASDPNFKMKRKSLAEVFPAAESYMKSLNDKSQQQQQQQQLQQQPASELLEQTQLQRNLSFHQPVLNHLNSKANISHNSNVNTIDIHDTPNAANVGGVGSVKLGVGSSESAEPAGDKDSILEWHRKKPSNWEMYYGTNRLSQSLLAAQRTNRQPANTQATMSYPSSRPESDFTLDLPRAEQLRIQMEKDKKFRQRCRYITAFMSLMFFLLTVVVVSLVLTRGKRMFGSMI